MIDRAALQVFYNYCTGIADACAFTLMRTAYSTFVKETQDFSCALLTPEGQTFASPTELGTTWYTGLDYGPVIRAVGDYAPDDICITNDPYSGAVATHTPDIHIWKPVFVEGELVCFVAGHIHNTDMGGAVPASISRSLSEVHQEGLRLPPTKIIRAGVLNEDVARIMRLNVRVPDQNWGDFNAQIAAVRVGTAKSSDIVRRYGLDNFRRNMYHILDYAEMQSRRIISNIPDGIYRHSEYADEDSEGGDPCRIALALKVDGDSMTLDFSGSDPQLTSSLNVPTAGNPRHSLVMIGLTNVLYTLNSKIILNAGTVRPAFAVLPEGTVVNPTAPAATGTRTLLCNVLQLVIFGALAKGMPGQLSASPAGVQTIVNVKTFHPNKGAVVASIGCIGGGAGGSSAGDGQEGAGGNSGSLSGTSIEIIEAEVPIRVRRYGLVPDSGGPGQQRGGSATMIEFEVFSPDSVVTARNRDKSLFPAWGLAGGKAGKPSGFIRNPDRPDARSLGNTDVVRLEPGDTVRLIGPGGGGFGDPYERSVNKVAFDVAKGVVSEAMARRDYGVVLESGFVNARETSVLRSAPRAKSEFMDIGESRAVFETTWNEHRYRALSSILDSTAVAWRHWVKKQIFAGIRDLPVETTEDGQDVFRIYKSLVARFPNISVSQNFDVGA